MTEEQRRAALATHVATLLALWHELCAAGGGELVRGRGFALADHPDPVLRNAILLEPDPAALDAVSAAPAIWTADAATGALVARSGRTVGETTTAMHCELATAPPATRRSFAPGVIVAVDVQPERIAALNGIAPRTLAGVSALQTYLARVDGRDAACVAAFRHGGDVNLSFVATAPWARRRGLATLLTAAALVTARGAGAATATLHATPMAEPLYAGLGFRPVATWREWTDA